MTGQIPVERDSYNKSRRALGAAAEALREGKLLGIYPEGTRSQDGRLYRGRSGVARLAISSGAPVIPCGVIGTQYVMPKGARFPRLTGPRGRIKVEVKFGKPLDFSRYKGRERDRKALQAATDEITDEILRLSGQEYANRYAPPSPRARLTESAQGASSDKALAG
jgi:1-acyl-sn-glycerol-3-phosphate acyltransferase